MSKALEFAKSSIQKGKLRDAIGEKGLDLEKKGSGLYSLITESKVAGQIQKELYQLGCDCTLKLKRKEDSLKWCRLATEVASDDIESLCNLGEAELLNENFEEGLTDLYLL